MKRVTVTDVAQQVIELTRRVKELEARLDREECSSVIGFKVDLDRGPDEFDDDEVH